MGISVKWFVPKRVIYFGIEGVLTVQNLDEAGKKIVELLDEGESPCYIVANLAEVTEVPKNIPQIHVVTKPFLNHPNMKWIFVCSNNALVNFIATVVGQVVGTGLFAGRTVDDAIEVIVKHEPRLQDKFDQELLGNIVQ